MGGFVSPPIGPKEDKSTSRPERYADRSILGMSDRDAKSYEQLMLRAVQRFTCHIHGLVS